MSDPDFLHLVDTNRLRMNVSNTSQKTQAQTTKALGMNQNITLRFEDGSTSTVPRFRLDKDFVQSAVNRMTAKKASSESKVVKVSHLVSSKDSTNEATTKPKLSPPPTLLLFSHLHHRDSNTIIMSNADLKMKCSANVIYDVIALPVVAIKEGGVLCGGSSSSNRRLTLTIEPSATTHHAESHYDGSVLFIIHDVPTTSQNGKYEVTENDVRRWIVSGAIRNTESVDVLTKKIESLKQTLLQLQQEMATLPSSTPHLGGKGRVTGGSSTQSSVKVKDKRANFLSDEMERSTTLLQTATQSLETLYAQHITDCGLSVEKRSSKNVNNKTCDWAIQVTGDKEEIYTSLIEKNKNWSMIPMYGFGIGAKGNKTPILKALPEEDQSGHFVDIGGISMSKLPHGFGIFESYEEFPLRKSRHRLYHGQFHEGQFSEGTLHTDAGVYTGKFHEGQPTVGMMEYTDGIKISGHFAANDVSMQTSTNPYCRGLPDGGEVLCKFPDKAIYKGNMSQGCITGKGYYKYAGLELSGQFQDGVLKVDGGDEGQGYSNLHLSFMFGGERLWGPTTTN